MWGNAFNEDDPPNAPTADLVRHRHGHQPPGSDAPRPGEWDRLPARSPAATGTTPPIPKRSKNSGATALERNKNYESLLTMGLRGRNDSEMVQGTDQAIELLNKIIPPSARSLPKPSIPIVTKVPQMWCLYKEVQGYYETGGLNPPEDITLLWAEDNNGNVRRLPTAEERKRSGGAGIYYHFDYHGGPTDYRWINTSPIPASGTRCPWPNNTAPIASGSSTSANSRTSNSPSITG
jgi:hypothetical protein